MLLPPLPERRRVDVSVVRKEVKTMYLENGRDIFRGILILIFAAIAFWVDLTTGLVLVAFMGAMILQSAFTDWCPADLLLRLMGLPKRG
jgi:hypothetical protein